MGFVRKVGAATNLITDNKYKDDAITYLSDAALVAAYRSTKRAKAASATGVAINSGVSTANPFFLGPAVLNMYQYGVGFINRKRVKEEVEKRKARIPGFAAWFEQEAEGKGTKDMLVGAGIKTAFTTVSCGVVGFDVIADNFTEVAAGGPSPAQAAVEAAAVPSPAPPAEAAATPKAEQLEAILKVEDPDLANADEVRGGIVGFLSQPFVEQVAEHTSGHVVTQETSMFDLVQQHDNGFSVPTLAAQVVSVGAANEVLQVPILAGEAVIDQALKEEQEKKAEKSRGE